MASEEEPARPSKVRIPSRCRPGSDTRILRMRIALCQSVCLSPTDRHKTISRRVIISRLQVPRCFLAVAIWPFLPIRQRPNFFFFSSRDDTLRRSTTTRWAWTPLATACLVQISSHENFRIPYRLRTKIIRPNQIYQTSSISCDKLNLSRPSLSARLADSLGNGFLFPPIGITRAQKAENGDLNQPR